MRPNVLLVVLDTARADACEPYGAPPGSTPVIADLARRGTALRRVFSTANWTLPSHASMFTGLLPRAIGLGTGSIPRDAMLRHRGRILPEVLRRSGYATAGVSANAMISPAFGFDTGFERFKTVATRRHAARPGLRGRIRWTLDAIEARLDDGLAAVNATVRGWLDEGPARPFFWFVNLMECHSPYLPPKPWNDLDLLGRYQAGEDARRYQSHAGFMRVCLGEIDPPDASLDRMRHLYRRSVSSMDDWLGRILGVLDERGLLSETLVVVTSDHGENLGDGHMLGHAISLDDRLLRVPLVAAGPGAPAPNGRLVSLVELPRMVAEAASLTDHPWNDAPMPAGVAVAQSDGFVTLAPTAAKQAADWWNLTPGAQREVSLRRSCVTDGRFKLVREGDGIRLHDLLEDPLELVDARGVHPAEVARLERVLDRVDAAEQAAPGGTPVGPAGPPAPDQESVELEERLKLLGYL